LSFVQTVYPPPSSVVKCLWGVFVWGVVLVVCVCVSVSGVLFSVGVCVCDLLIFLQTVYEMDDKPSALRYPRGSALGLDVLNDLFDYGLEEYPDKGTALPLGKGRVIRKGREGAPRKVAILSFGTRLAESVLAARKLEEEDEEVAVTVADARWMKPLDTALVGKLATEHEVHAHKLSLSLYIYIYIYVCVCVCVCVSVYTYRYIFFQLYLNLDLHPHTHVYIYVCVYIYMYTYIYAVVCCY